MAFKGFSAKRVGQAGALFLTFLLVVSTFFLSREIQNNRAKQTRKTGAQISGYPGSFAGRFQETTIFAFDAPNKIFGYFTTNHRQHTQSSSLPPFATFNNGSLTISSRGGIIFDNPAKSEGFYRIEVTLEDAGQQSLTSYITGINQLWVREASGTPTQGFSAGIGRLGQTTQPNTYWWEHTGLKTQSQVTAGEWDFTNKTWNKFDFLKRKAQDVRIDIYVAPNGVYPVINGANLGSLPNMYTGEYTFRGARPNYLVLAKWDAGGDRVTFKNFKIVRLDNAISSVHDVNAYFIKKTVEAGAFQRMVSDTVSTNGGSGYANALWAAFLYRAYDYYYHTNNVDKVRQMYDIFLVNYSSYVNQNVSKYSKSLNQPFDVGFINTTQAFPIVTWALTNYLRPDQLQTARLSFAKTVDVIEALIKSDGTFPKGTLDPYTTYNSDTYAEIVSWILSFYTGYVATYPNDRPRVDKTLDYIKFLGFHHLSDGKSLRDVYSSQIQFTYLGDSYKDFKSQYIWTSGEIDNHNFHPSVNYAIGVIGAASYARNILQKIGYTMSPLTLTRNLDLTYQKNIKDKLDFSTFRLKSYTPLGRQPTTTVAQDDVTFNSDGTISDFTGRTKPSLLEDWTVTWPRYSVIEYYGDPSALSFARNVYYSFYPGSGALFCGHGTSSTLKCEASATNFWSYNFGDSLYAMLLSNNSQYSDELPKTGNFSAPPTPSPDRDCTFSTRAVYVDKKTNTLTDSVTRGSRIYTRLETPGWWRDESTIAFFYNSDPNAPCYNKGAGTCSFTTRNVIYDQYGKQVDSVTIGPNYYNWTDGTGWWKVNHDLASVPRYKENQHAPCWNRQAGGCSFTTRYILYRPGTTIYDEFITVGPNYYQYASDRGWLQVADHDLTANPYYKQNSNAPCYGKARAQCTFSSILKYYDTSGVWTESVIVGDKFYNYTNGTGWWPVTDRRLGYTGRFLETNGPCLTP